MTEVVLTNFSDPLNVRQIIIYSLNDVLVYSSWDLEGDRRKIQYVTLSFDRKSKIVK